MFSTASFLTWAVVAVALMTSYTQAQFNLFPDWNLGSGGNGRPANPAATTNRPASSNCEAYLDVNRHGNPNCPTNQQFFDYTICRFVCDPGSAASSQNGVGDTKPNNNIP